jgi:D-3-phosphoglycerate dehydrogenase
MIIARAVFKAKAFAQASPVQIAIRGLADIQADIHVEHGRGDWQTYGNVDNYKQGKYQIKTFNKISPVGLSRFPGGEYDVRTGDLEAANAHAILLRSHKLQEEEVPTTVRAIAR